MMAQSLFCLADFRDTLRRDRSEFISRAQAIVSTTFTLASCTELLLVVQGAYRLAQPCLGKDGWPRGTHNCSLNSPTLCSMRIFEFPLAVSM